MEKKTVYTVAVVGALGAVGKEMTAILAERSFPIGRLRPLDVGEKAGTLVAWKGGEVPVEPAGKGAFTDVDLALFSAGAEASRSLAPLAAEEGVVVVDNSSQWRMNPEVPLVVPEVNPEAAFTHHGIIANPNCSTIQMVVALKPLHEAFTIRRILVSTYQAVSGSGLKGVQELNTQAAALLAGKPAEHRVYPHRIAGNTLPHIDVFLENGYTKEEMKMVNETKKILDPSIAVTATTVRVPVVRGHSEAVNIQTEKPFDLDTVREILAAAPGVALLDDPSGNVYPTPEQAENRDPVFVGRIRRDETVENGLNLWIVADNLRKGAALNAVQIAELLTGTREGSQTGAVARIG